MRCPDPTRRKFRPGEEREIAGIRFRVAEGAKSPNDLRLDWMTPDGWQAVPMAAGFFFADFFYENEDVLIEKYPYAQNFQGGEMYLRAIRTAGREGWEKAQAGLASQQAGLFDRTAS